MSGLHNPKRLKKHAVLWATLAVALLVLAACAQPAQPAATATPAQADATTSATPDQTDTTATPTQSALLELTLEELAEYNGKDGKPAYVAVDGVIYDMTNSARWRNGEHNGFSAGQDLTDAIKNQSPHGVANLSRVPVVGKIKE